MPLIGANGGLIGAARTSRRGAAVGVWTPNEQVAYQRQNAWIGDTNFESVSLLLHMDGSNASTTFIDSSKNALSVTANGNAQISTAQSKFGGSSGLFDGSGDAAIITTGLNNFTMSGNAYTLEAWIRPSVVSGSRPVISITAASASFFGLIALSVSGGALAWESRHNTGSGFANVNGTGGTVTVDTWHHVALSVDNGTARAYLNGAQVGTNQTFTAPAFTVAGVGIGAFGNLFDISTACFNGYIDELRITKGVARYTANFTPSAAPFPD